MKKDKKPRKPITLELAAAAQQAAQAGAAKTPQPQVPRTVQYPRPQSGGDGAGNAPSQSAVGATAR